MHLMGHIKESDLAIEYAPNESPVMFVYVLVDQEDRTRSKIDTTGCLLHVTMAHVRGLDRPVKMTAAQRAKQTARWRPELFVGPFPGIDQARDFKDIVVRRAGEHARADLLKHAIELANQVDLTYYSYTKCLKQ